MEEMIRQCTQMMNSMGSMMSNGMMGGMMNGNMMGSGLWWASPWYWLGWAWVLALLVLIVIAFVWSMRRASRPAPNTESPFDILKRRYARGEISPEQFEAMKRQLSES